MAESIDRYRLSVAPRVLADLARRLAAARLPDQLPGTGWEYGADRDSVAAILRYWRDDFDWPARQRELNRLDQFTTEIDGQKLHFVHVRSPCEGALPLLLSHGWPGSMVEFQKIIGPLSDPEAHGGRACDAFHVVCPSLPGFPLSGPTVDRGWDAQRMAGAFAELMSRLGYARYGAQGGDWGALISTWLGLDDPAHVCGIHITMPLATPPPDLGADALSDSEKADLASLAAFERDEAGYQRIQGTKPQTLGFALMDSPAGLAAWILEKFHGWSDCGGDLESAFSRDELLTNIQLYWVTGTITSSMRLYYEVFKGGRLDFDGRRVEVPTGVARFPVEILRIPRPWVARQYNLQHWTDMPRGGYFAALEQPELLVEDVRTFFRKIR